MIPTEKLIETVLKDDSSMYENVLLENAFHSNFSHADFTKYLLTMINDEISRLMDTIPEEYAQDLHTAWEAISRIESKMKGETK